MLSDGLDWGSGSRPAEKCQGKQLAGTITQRNNGDITAGIVRKISP